MESGNRQKSWGLRFAQVLILALVYFISGKLGLDLALVNRYATAVWPPTGLALAGLLLWGSDVWPGVLLGALGVNLITGNLSAAGIAASLGIAAGDTLAVVVAAYLVERWANGTRAFERVRDVLSFAALAGFLAPTISTTIGVATLAVADLAIRANYDHIWFIWWIGNAVGTLVFAPLAVLWTTNYHIHWTRKRKYEAALVALLLALASLAVFTSILPPYGPFLSLAVLGIVPLLWVVFRFGSRETATAILLMSAIALWGATHGLLARFYNEPRALLDVQEYVGISAIIFLVLAAEVSERRHHESALAMQTLALTQYAKLVDLGTVIMRDAQDRITGWTSGAERLYGYKKEEAVGKVSHVLLRTRFPESLERIQASLRDKGRWEGELQHTTKDGREIVVASLQVVQVDKAGRPAVVLEVNNDITERKRAEEALLKSEERERARAAEFEAIMQAAPVPIWIARDAECLVITGNPASYDLTRLPLGANVSFSAPDGERPKNFQIFQDGRLLSPEELPLQRAARGESVRDFEMQLRFDDGSWRYLLGNASPLVGAQGKVLGAVMACFDITERREAARRAAAQLVIARLLAETSGLDEVAPKILETLCETLGWEAGSLWALDPASHVLRCVQIWHDPGLSMTNFAKVTSQTTFTLGSGLPGRVCARGNPTWIPDFAEDDDFPRALVAMSEGLHSALGIPILLGERCLGAIEFYSRGSRQPDESLVALLVIIGGQIGHFMERERAEAALRESQTRLSLALKAARTYAWDWDLATGEATRSENALEILGFEPTTIEESWKEIHPDDRFAVKRAYAEAIRSGKLDEADFRIVRPDGEVRWISSRAEVRYGPDGQPRLLSGVAADVTARKRAEENLRLTIESIPNAVVVVNPQGKIAFVNAQTEKWFGYQREELLGLPVETLVPERFRQGHEADRQAFFVAPAARPMGMGRELYGLRKDGSEFPVEVGLSPFHTEQGAWITAAITDISERRRTEQQRMELLAREQALSAQKQLTEIVANSPDFINMTDPEGRVVYLNPAGRKMVGLSEEHDIFTLQKKDFYPEWAWDVVRNVALPEAERSGFWSGEVTLKSRDGTEIPVSETIVAHRDSEGTLLGFSTVARDITGRKRAEHALEEMAGRLIHAQEEERSRIGRELHDHVGQMIALVAMQLDLEGRHDLSDLAKQAAEDVRQLSHRLHSSTLEDFGLVPTLNRLVSEFRERRGIHVDFKAPDVPSSLSPEIDLCLLRIVEECLNNVARHSGARSSRVELNYDDEGIHLSVQDDGSGFDPDAAQKARGLGLVSIRERLRVLHGEMRIHSRPAQGSKIEVSIPTESLRHNSGNGEAAHM